MADTGNGAAAARRLSDHLEKVVYGLLMAAILGLFLMWQKVVLQEERHAAMLRIDEIQSANIQGMQVQHAEMMRTIELLRERQGVNIRAIESLATLINGVVSMNSEQQYQIGLLQERARLLERRAPAEQP